MIRRTSSAGSRLGQVGVWVRRSARRPPRGRRILPSGFDIVIRNPHGLHARPATALVNLAKSFQATIRVRLGDRVADAKSLISLLKLGGRERARPCGSWPMVPTPTERLPPCGRRSRAASRRRPRPKRKPPPRAQGLNESRCTCDRLGRAHRRRHRRLSGHGHRPDPPVPARQDRRRGDRPRPRGRARRSSIVPIESAKRELRRAVRGGLEEIRSGQGRRSSARTASSWRTRR